MLTGVLDFYQCAVILCFIIRPELFHMIKDAVQILMNNNLTQSRVSKGVAGAVLGLNQSVCHEQNSFSRP